jgi:hypothetical protein
MPPARVKPHTRMINELIGTDPEAESQLREARHWHVLAMSSEAAVREALTVLRAARRRREDCRNILDPRRRRQIHLVLSLAAFAIAAAALAVLNRAELRAVRTGSLTLTLVIAATAVWLGWAWRAALARRDRERRQNAVLTATGGAFAVLLAVLGGRLSGVVVALLILGVAVMASALIERTEPVQLMSARRRWRRAKQAHAEEVRKARRDAEAATAAMTAWLTLVDTRVRTATADERLVSDCITYAAAMVVTQAEIQPAARPGL